MASIKVKFRPSTNIGKEGSIYYQVIHERKIKQIPTEYRVFPWEWNHERASVSCGSDNVRMPYLLSVRERIKMDIERVGKIIRNLDKTRFDYSSDDIVAEYERVVEENSLFHYIEGIIVKMKCNGKVRTAETYRAALNSFRKYRDGEDIMLESLSRDEMVSYEAWLRQQGKAPNTVSFYIRILRAVYNRAVEDGLTEDKTPFRKVYTGVEKTVKRALPMEVIKKIKSLDLTFHPEIEFARDIFILSFMLRGMSFIDMAFLKKTDLNNGYITYRRRKTGQQLIIQWTEDMQTIVDKYPTAGTDYLLPIIRNPNSIAFYAYRNVSYSINRHLRTIAESLDLSSPLTMYVARHSWASAAKAKGVPLSVISEGMGHDSEMTTQIYLASLDTTAVDRANSILLQELAQ
ncbi:MAG: site-specific integrase [Muribaculaceae bacterium]|nr:site-specific integrase [Muribaculaceae bacterium]MDE6553788.1 site-specific integrase [Muribaculaceae bacterium]